MLGSSDSNVDPRKKRLKHLVLWRTFSSLRRLLPAPLVAFILGDAAILPHVALAFALGPFALPIALWGPFSFGGWVWYVVLLVWTADMTYFVYYERPDILDALRAVDRPALPRPAAAIADGGSPAYGSVRDLVRNRRSRSPRQQLRWMARWTGVFLAVYLLVGIVSGPWYYLFGSVPLSRAILIAFVGTFPVPFVVTALLAAVRVHQLTDSIRKQ